MTDILKDDHLFPYLQGIHLAGMGEVMLTIRLAHEEAITNQNGTRQAWVVYFQESHKGLILNKTNTVAIVNSTGERDTDKWPGKVIRVKAEVVKAFGKEGPAVRVNPQPPTRKALEAFLKKKEAQSKKAQKDVDQLNEELGLGQ